MIFFFFSLLYKAPPTTLPPNGGNKDVLSSERAPLNTYVQQYNSSQ